MREWRKGVVLAAVVVLAGCAKHPAMTATSAPAPTAGAGQVGARASSGAQGPGGSGVVTASHATPATPGARPAPKEFHPVEALRTIHFAFDKYDIRTEDAKLLDANAAWLKGNPKTLMLIEGHADERGTNEYNLALGDRRAKATMNYLIGHGVAASRISTISYGEERPLCTQHNETCWAQNRRAQFLVKAE